jgi:hypothetical protein
MFYIYMCCTGCVEYGSKHRNASALLVVERNVRMCIYPYKLLLSRFSTHSCTCAHIHMYARTYTYYTFCSITFTTIHFNPYRRYVCSNMHVCTYNHVCACICVCVCVCSTVCVGLCCSSRCILIFY